MMESILPRFFPRLVWGGCSRRHMSGDVLKHFAKVIPTEAVHVKDCTDHQYTLIYDAQIPIIIRECSMNWPCMSDPIRKWSNINELKSRVAQMDSIVPVEIGNHYMDPQLQKHSISLESYLEFQLNMTWFHHQLKICQASQRYIWLSIVCKILQF